jgi:hypothetical protein
MEPVEVLTVLKLVVEPTERPELYDFLFGSGVVLDEDGVEVVLRGSIDGDRDEARTSFGGSGVVEVNTWVVSLGWCIDIRFALRVSVGLIVRAPRPVAWPGMADARLLAADKLPGLLPPGRGDRGMLVNDLVRSGVRLIVSAETFVKLTLGGGCIDFALDALDAVKFLVSPPNPNRLPPSMEERADPGTVLSEFEAILGLLARCAVLLAYSVVSKAPGPTDFLGGLPMLLFETGG